MGARTVLPPTSEQVEVLSAGTEPGSRAAASSPDVPSVAGSPRAESDAGGAGGGSTEK